MQAWIVRGVCALIGAALSVGLRGHGGTAFLPFALSVAVVGLELFLRPGHVKAWAPLLVGAALGLALTALAMWMLTGLQLFTPPVVVVIVASLGAVFVTAGTLSFYHRRDLFVLPRATESGRRSDSPRILDTSVIIDGRIANIARTAFLQGHLILPRFVLKELQYIADSSDTLRRNKGRRGMEVLSDLQNNPDLTVEIVDEEFPEIEEVDAKLVALAKSVDGKIVTNDYNLKGIAEIQGVQVMNVNELANAVKPEIIQGEMMSVRVIREGKEPGQGVAYLDDGTMVVVDQGKRVMHQTVTVEVTSVLQTSAGRMIFARIREIESR